MEEAAKEFQSALKLDPKKQNGAGSVEAAEEELRFQRWLPENSGQRSRMDIRETISVAIDALRANKLRAILTSLGVIIGSASIVLVVTVA